MKIYNSNAKGTVFNFVKGLNYETMLPAQLLNELKNCGHPHVMGWLFPDEPELAEKAQQNQVELINEFYGKRAISIRTLKSEYPNLIVKELENLNNGDLEKMMLGHHQIESVYNLIDVLSNDGLRDACRSVWGDFIDQVTEEGSVYSMKQIEDWFETFSETSKLILFSEVVIQAHEYLNSGNDDVRENSQRLFSVL